MNSKDTYHWYSFSSKGNNLNYLKFFFLEFYEIRFKNLYFVSFENKTKHEFMHTYSDDTFLKMDFVNIEEKKHIWTNW